MIISHSRKFIFIHVRKTAGESITAALAPYLSSTDLTIGTTFKGKVADLIYPKMTPLKKHVPATILRSHLSPDVWSSYFKFAFIRNPIDHTQSFYKFLGNMLEKREEKTVRNILLNLPGTISADPLKWPVSRAYRETASFSEFIRHPAFKGHGQWKYLCDPGGAIMVDFVGRFENLDSDFAHVTERIGLGKIALARRNASRDPATPDTVSLADRAYLAEMFKRDFEIFAYDAVQTTCL